MVLSCTGLATDGHGRKKMLSKTMNREKWIAIIVAAAMLLMAPLQSWAGTGGTANAAGEEEYISEVYTAYGSDEASAKKALEEKGYTAVEGNLNESGKTYVMLGYKKTKDKNKAIRHMAVMNSRGGYSVGDYENVLKEKKAEIADFLKKYMPAIKEYRANYKDGIGKAKLVHDILNNYIEDDTKMGMGDLLLADTLQDKVGISESITADNSANDPDLVKVIMQGNTVIIESIFNILAMASDSSDSDFITRFSKKTYEDMLADLEKTKPELTEPKRVQYLDGQYQNTAKVLFEYAKAMRADFKEYEDSGLSMKDAKQEDIEKQFGKAGEMKTAEEIEAANKYARWVSIGTQYEFLKAYEGGRFKKGELLEFFKSKSKEEDIKDYYPMAAALTKGQESLLTMIPLSEFIRYAMSDNETWAKEAKDKKGEFKDAQDISVYSNIDRDIYKSDGQVALTDEAKRKKAEVLPFDFGSKGIRNTLAVVAGVGWVATAVSVVAAIKSASAEKLVPFITTDAYADKLDDYLFTWVDRATIDPKANYFLDLEKQYGSATEAINNMKFTNSVASETAKSKAIEFAKERDAALLETKISNPNPFKYASIALALISAGITIAALLTEESVDLPPVPKYMVDTGQNKEGKTYALNYRAALGNGMEYIKKAKANKGEYADLKAYEGKQWLTVYTSTEKSAGKPILADFKVQKEKEIPGGYDQALHIVGEKGAVNLINKDYMNLSRAKELARKTKTTYLFYKHSTESEGTASAFSGGMIAIIVIGGVAVAALIAALVRRSKKNAAAA